MRARRRLSNPTILVLASLAAGPSHAAAIHADILKFSGVDLGPGTLFGVISRLEQDGVIEALPSKGTRRPYRLTASGAGLAEEQLRLAADAGNVGLRRLGAEA